MTKSVYNSISLVGTSTESWEKAAKAAVETAAKTIRDIRIAEIEQLDMKIEGGKVVAYRAKINLSFRVEKGDEETFHKTPHDWFVEKEHPSFDG